MSFYNLKVEEVLAELKTSKEGLSRAEVNQRRQEFGWNKVMVKGEPLWRKVLAPFLNVMILILVVAAGLSMYQGEWVDAIIILATIFLNAVIEWAQTFSTERILRKLRETDGQKVSVRRGGGHVSLPSVELVPGDIVHLTEGEKVPADLRIIESHGLAVNESMLTGESLPVNKSSEALQGTNEVYNQINMLFSGSFVTAGGALAVVVGTGNQTQFGSLAQLTAMGGDEISPVQKKINKLVRQMISAVAIISVVAFALALIRGIEFTEALRFILALAVSAVPEGLPVAITVILVLGMRRMAKQKALVRNARAIENIGEVTVIATDKTGTLTKNQLSVQDFWSVTNLDSTLFAREIGLSINETKAKNSDPLDVALSDFATERKSTQKPLAVLPFNYEKAMSGNIWHLGGRGKLMAYVKGAPEKVLAHSRLTPAKRRQALKELHEMTRRGERVIGFARLPVKAVVEKVEDLGKRKMEFIGLVSVADSLRSTAHHAIYLADNAGIDVKIITGDHAETAYHIANKLGVANSPDDVFDATRLEKSKVSLADVRRATVFARVVPETKFKILEFLKRSEITAMTGDGVNDVPALSKADIGVAMGSGSQIAKDASDIVLLDDNFKSIVACIKESRVILENIKRMLVYLVSTNIGEILVSLVALVVGMPLPLVAVQILWINLVTDSILVIPMGLEPGHEGIMKRPPNNPRSPILNKQSIGLMIVLASITAGITLTVYGIFLNSHGLDYARTIVFATLIFIQIVIAWTVRSMHTSVLKYRVRNRKFLLAVVVSVLLQSAIMFTDAGEFLFKLVDLDWLDLILTMTATAAVVVLVTEVYKLISKRFKND